MIKLMEKFTNFVEKKTDNSVEELIEKAASYYFGMICCMSHDSVTESEITEGIDEDFDYFFEQEPFTEVYNEFTKENNITWEEFINAFNIDYKEDVIKYLQNDINYIAEDANRSED